MAIFYLQVQDVSRSAGRSAVAAAAYRAGERLRDERTGTLHNYSRRTDVRHTEILLPRGLAGSDPGWATERASLWNAAERAEVRRNARVACEYQVALPAELTDTQRLALARSFARELAQRHSVAVDLAVHAPRPGGDARNHHAHLLATTRQVTAAGFGAKAGLHMQAEQRLQLGLPDRIAEMVAIRARWAVLSNEALAAAGLQQRIDHRSLRAQGIDREPVPRIPMAAVQIERRGAVSPIAQRIRAQYRDRVQRRRERAPAIPEARPAAAPTELEDIRRQAREAWLELRRQGGYPAAVTASAPHIEESPSKAQPEAVPKADRDLAL
ncbi:MAG TPA: MobQ family relaxase [Steroidobacteraceae bacterium]